jgi:hypothetical protein
MPSKTASTTMSARANPWERRLCNWAPLPIAQRTASSVGKGPRASLAESNSPETISLLRKSGLVFPTWLQFSSGPGNPPEQSSCNLYFTIRRRCQALREALAQSWTCACAPRPLRTVAAHRGIAPCFAFWYPVGRAPLTRPVAHVQSKLELFHIRNGSGAKC